MIQNICYIMLVFFVLQLFIKYLHKYFLATDNLQLLINEDIIFHCRYFVLRFIIACLMYVTFFFQ